MDAWLLMKYAEIEAIKVKAEIEGMKALNKERELNDYSLAYDESVFLDRAVMLRKISEEINKQR